MNANNPRLTFSEFQAAGRDCGDVAAFAMHKTDDALPRAGRWYPFDLTIERRENDGRDPSWECETSCVVHVGDLETMEREMYGFYVVEHADPDVRDYLIDAAPECSYINQGGRPSQGRLAEIYSSFGCQFQYTLGCASAMVEAGVDDAGKRIAPEHLDWLRDFISRWEAAGLKDAALASPGASAASDLQPLAVVDHLIDVAEKRVAQFRDGYQEGRDVRSFLQDLIDAAHRADGDERPGRPERGPGYSDEQWELILRGWDLRSQALFDSGLRSVLVRAERSA